MLLQTVIHAIYPPQCLLCDTATASERGLCPSCWRGAQFIGDVICDQCGVLLPGDDFGEALQCDDCMTIARPWDKGRAALAYSGMGRRLVLALKHGDRSDLAGPAAGWMAARLGGLVAPETVVVPIPLHWQRMIRRRYNQAALLAKALGRHLMREVCLDALYRPAATPALKGKSREARFTALLGAIIVNPKRQRVLAGRPVLLVDDVMTSGATLAAGAEALHAAGAAQVNVVTLARTLKDA